MGIADILFEREGPPSIQINSLQAALIPTDDQARRVFEHDINQTIVIIVAVYSR